MEGQAFASHSRKEGSAGLAYVSSGNEMLKDEGNTCEKVLESLTNLQKDL